MSIFRNGLTVAGLVVICLLVGEASASMVLSWLDADNTTALARRPAFATADHDPEALFAIIAAAGGSTYQPYTLWKHREWHGSGYNVGEYGHRATLHGSTAPDASRVWILGASTVFGYGVPDGQTLPSHLAGMLARAELPADVVNLGEVGYVSMQEWIRLSLELHRQPTPDLVIVHSGFNDSFTSWGYPKGPATHFALGSVREHFERPLLAAVRDFAIYDLAARVRYRLLPPSWPPPPRADTTKAAGEWVGDHWLQNMRMIEALGRVHGYETLVALQPVAGLGDKPLHPSEQSSVFRSGALHSMYAHILEKTDTKPIVVDLTRAFDEIREPLYFDAVHVNGTGNEILARELVRAMCRRAGIVKRLAADTSSLCP